MPYQERTDEEIISAWEQWLETLKHPDRKTILFGRELLSPREFVERMRNGDEEVLAFGVTLNREIAREEGCDPVQEILQA